MDSQLKSIVNKTLYNAFLDLAKEDPVLKKASEQSDNLEKFVNSLLAAIVCICDREIENQIKIASILEANPQVKQILELKNDPSVLCKEQD
jgi:spore coat protein CotF